MTIKFVDTYRTTCLQQLGTAVGSAGKIIVYSGTQPAKGAAAGTALVTFTCAAGAVSGGAPFFSSITAGVGIVDVTGMAQAATSGGAGTTATWARLTTSGGAFVADMTVGGSSSFDLSLDNTSIVGPSNPPASTVTMTSMTITAMGA